MYIRFYGKWFHTPEIGKFIVQSLHIIHKIK